MDKKYEIGDRVTLHYKEADIVVNGIVAKPFEDALGHSALLHLGRIRGTFPLETGVFNTNIWKIVEERKEDAEV